MVGGNEAWLTKYAPKKSSEVLGQGALARMVASVDNWKRSSKPLLLFGPSGSGKTATATAIAKEKGLELIEINASDNRNKDAIETLVGGALKQGSLFGGGKLVLIDEVEGLSGTKDRGSIPTLLKVIKNSPYPVVLTLENPFESKFSSLRKACELFEFVTLDSKAIVAHITTILQAENIAFTEEDVLKIARSSGGDMRAGVNDTHMMSTTGTLIVDTDLLGQREQGENIQQALTRVLKTTQASMARGAFDKVNEDINKVMLWASENVASEYTKAADLARAYDALSEADKFLGRIRRWQHYRFYVYAYDLVTAGVACAKDEKYKGMREYKQSSRILQIWMANQKNAKKKAIAEKMAYATHTSARRTKENIPFLQHIMLNNKAMGEALCEDYDLDSEEKTWLKK